MIENILDAQGHIVPTALACKYNTTVEELSIFSGVSLNTLKKRDRSSKPITQAKLQVVVEIINKVTPWAGSEQQAYAWYRSEPIPAFGDLTPENLVVDGKANIVRKYIRHLALSGFA